MSGDNNPPVHWTPPTYELALTLAQDTLKLHGGTYDCPFTETELKRLTQVSRDAQLHCHLRGGWARNNVLQCGPYSR